MNSVVLTGRLTRDPEIRYTATGKAVVNFTLAVKRKGKDDEQKADFPRIVVYGYYGETCQQALNKGSNVCVQGELRTGSYKNKDGVTVYTTDIVADIVEFLDNKSHGESDGYAYINEDVPL